ncbi:hypothetical protein SteCoe_37799 [Stentor coeruleus]|uniref:Uncharacterized protein n=1 Tax=Stentor coeruleus TaxID=5963 RepID=A0A1R2AMC1_9CILI|nr:hypothetical protein SteCoe_37810 [Stentor coeruleus]OMJ65678.1 hypothetical protein SteCoe_37799 [Stentor coeruleus]
MDEEYNSVTWYFDESRNPCCMSMRSNSTCQQEQCRFSHNQAKYKAEMQIMQEDNKSPEELFFFISYYASVNLTETSYVLVDES